MRTILLIFFLAGMLMAQPADTVQAGKHKVYFMAGQGADERSLQYLTLDPRIERVYIPYLVPEKGESMSSYAHRMAASINPDEDFSIVGVSLGGMIAVEMTRFLNPRHVVVIASAKGASDIAPRYKLLKYLPLHTIFGDWGMKRLSPLGRRLFEPDSQPFEPIYQAMIADKPDQFIHRATACIATWETAQPTRTDIVHIHGSKDHTLPIRNIQKVDYVIKGGGHMMITTHAAQISEILNKILLQ